MGIVIGLYIFFQLGFIIFAVISSITGDKRYKAKPGSKILLGFEKTDEITVDPNNGKRFRVYYNPSNGERVYHEESNDV